MASSSGVAKTIDRTRSMIESGSHYEAQQTLKTVYHRSRARKQLQDSYQILKEGAMLQLRHGQVTCGVELGIMLVEAFTQDKPPVDVALAAILSVLSCLPSGPLSASGSDQDAMLAEEGRLASAAVKWAQRCRPSQVEAARQIHDAFAWHVWQTFGWARMGRATAHFVHGSDADKFAQALYACSKQAPEAEADLFTCRAVLQTLATASSPLSATRQLAYAKQVLQACLRRSPALESSPLVHFTSLLIQALERRSKALTLLLKQRYEASLERDPVLEAYMTQVERVFLGIGAGNGGGLGGLLGNLLKSLSASAGEDEDEDEDDEEGEGEGQDDYRS